jgi:prepilin-type N-terminal cleavage/methylation domain-containing protein
MYHKRTAFTLIELLVVIAIIAILAAILFPVFAQAKLAAKAAASLSNTKQQSLGILMYANDYDDEWIPHMQYWLYETAPFTPVPAEIGNYPYCGLATWGFLVLPYIKTGAIFIDPIAGGTNGETVDVDALEGENPEYGLNWVLLNGGFDNTFKTNIGGQMLGEFGTTSTTAVSRPSDMVMLSSTSLHTDATYEDYFYYFGQYGLFGTVLGVVEGPYCDYQTTGCNDLSSYWGTDNGWANEAPDTYPSVGYTEGGDTSGNAMRDNGLVVTAFCDGHSKAMSPGALAVGTTWSPTATKSQVQLINKDTYRWFQY